MKTQKNSLLKFAAVGTCCFGVLMPASAKAETVDLRYTGTANVVATEVKIPVQASPISVYMGTYNIEQQTPANSFLAYCSDPFQYSNNVFQSYFVKTPLSMQITDPGRLSDVNALFSHAYANSLTTATKAAGFQLAMWEMWHDDKNLGFGLVQATSNTVLAVRNEAQSLLDQLSLNSWSLPASAYQVTVYTNDSYQDYVTAAPVPEPETYALMLVGLGLLGSVVARRRNV